MSYSRRNTWLLLISLVFLFLPYIYISRFASPVADDFIYAAMGKTNELLPFLHRHYLGWSGRYSANILVLINPLAYNSFFMYKLMPVMLIVLLVLSCLFFVDTLIGKQQTSMLSLTIALLFSLLFLYQMPILSEGIYWYTGSVTYQLGTIIISTYIALLLRYTQGRLLFKNKSIHGFVLTLLLITGIGFNEVHTIGLLLFAAVSLFIVIKNKLEHKQLFSYLFTITFVFSCIMLLAPGNENRATQVVNNHRLLYSFVLSCAQAIRFFLEWTSSIPLLVMSMLYYSLNKKLSENNPLFSASFYLSPVYSIVNLQQKSGQKVKRHFLVA